jgi:flagellar motor switch protein FliN
MPDDLFSTGAANPSVEPDTSPFPNIDDEDAGAGGNQAGSAAAKTAEPTRFDLVLNIPVRLSVELGRAEIPIRDIVNVGRGSVIELDRNLGEPLDVRVNGVLIGHGEIVVIDEQRLGLRFVDVVSRAERVSGLT